MINVTEADVNAVRNGLHEAKETSGFVGFPKVEERIVAALDLIDRMVWDSVLERACSDALGSQMLELQRESISLRQHLIAARDMFNVYEQSHRRKLANPALTRELYEDAERKAATNRHMAERLTAAIGDAKPKGHINDPV